MSAAEQVAANVRLLRTRRGWTQDQLADRMGHKSPQVVWSTEVGRRRITVNDLVEYAAAFGVTPERLMSEDPETGGASSVPMYEVTVDSGLAQTFAANHVDLGETWTSFFLNGTPVFSVPTARVLGARLIRREATDA
ncbi:helix-turn-helix protein [Streptomyces sp. KhCrAH-43]|uniref:helix-turn-helix domain-containing protein n=1 Tax=unclassified Streptomyces TaxID=2593676 RepID=UPI00037D33F5|nr:helix-turn-helix transcriptional regulator [Streptomyces sp. KhCrAH-43]MYX67344.1 helix-turn-helix domain-containing protein [Streptomyces sp. SID8373]RAJ53812.1 helix-turn-helix protein [Streptomyces sp. KhCrAH-43]